MLADIVRTIGTYPRLKDDARGRGALTGTQQRMLSITWRRDESVARPGAEPAAFTLKRVGRQIDDMLRLRLGALQHLLPVRARWAKRSDAYGLPGLERDGGKRQQRRTRSKFDADVGPCLGQRAQPIAEADRFAHMPTPIRGLGDLACRGDARIRDAAYNGMDLDESFRAGARRPGTTSFPAASADFSCADAQVRFSRLRLETQAAAYNATGYVDFKRQISLEFTPLAIGKAARLTPVPVSVPVSVSDPPNKNPFDVFALTGALNSPTLTRVTHRASSQ